MPLARTTIGSRFGYSGSGRRIWSATASWRAGTWWSVLGYVAAVTLLSVAWILVTLWYLVLIAVLGSSRLYWEGCGSSGGEIDGASFASSKTMQRSCG
jgi:hypothetical protein